MKKSLAAACSGAPQSPGVYVMRDGHDSVIYVGKSINLRKRLLQHAASQRAGYSDRNFRWLSHVTGIEWHETRSELFALLLEDQLIKSYWPSGNVRQKDFLEYAWLAFSGEAIPRLAVIDARQRDAFEHLFGPFRDSYQAQDMADLVTERFRLRTCAATRPGGCARLEIRRCTGPCRSSAAAGRYREAINRAIASLGHLDPHFIRFMEARTRRHVQVREYEKAAHYHGMLQRYRSLIRRQRFLALFRRHGVLIQEQGRWPNTWLFYQGRLLPGDGQERLIPPAFTGAETAHSEWQIIDRAHVIYQWLHTRRSEGGAAILDRRFFREDGGCVIIPRRWIAVAPPGAATAGSS